MPSTMQQQASQSTASQSTQIIAPTVAANLTSPPPQRPMGHNGTTRLSTSTPMDDEADEQGDDADFPMRAQSVASSSSQSTVSIETMMDIKQMMWTQAVSPQCSPMVLQQLVGRVGVDAVQ
eukprot:3402236-Amphidinium_carterae.1